MTSHIPPSDRDRVREAILSVLREDARIASQTKNPLLKSGAAPADIAYQIGWVPRQMALSCNHRDKP